MSTYPTQRTRLRSTLERKSRVLRIRKQHGPGSISFILRKHWPSLKGTASNLTTRRSREPIELEHPRSSGGFAHGRRLGDLRQNVRAVSLSQSPKVSGATREAALDIRRDAFVG